MKHCPRPGRGAGGGWWGGGGVGASYGVAPQNREWLRRGYLILCSAPVRVTGSKAKMKTEK
jgi:hypothetical protein